MGRLLSAHGIQMPNNANSSFPGAVRKSYRESCRAPFGCSLEKHPTCLQTMCATRLRQGASRGGKALTAGLRLAGELGCGADEHMPYIIVHRCRHGVADTPKMLQFSLAVGRLRNII